MGVNSFEYFGETIFDISEDTVTADVLPEGVTAHDANGDPIVGTKIFVESVNGKSGKAIKLEAGDVGAEKEGTASTAVSTHNVATDAHNDIRIFIQGLSDRVNAIANSDDTTLDDFKEVVAYIKANRDLIDEITSKKINYTDIINDLTTNVENKPLSAAQGVVIKRLIDGLESGKLDASKLTEAINTALAQAKASGEFDGEDGDPGVGITKAEVVNGNLVITYSTGNKETAGKVKGEDGKDGVLTSAQKELLGRLEDWYDESHYQNMTCDFTSTKASTTVDIGSSFEVTFGWDFDKELRYLEVGNTVYDTKEGKDPPEDGSVTETFALSQEGTLSFEITGKHAGTYGEEVCTNTWTYNFRNKVYYGLKEKDDPDTVDQSFIKQLSKSAYATTFKIAGHNFNDNNAKKYIWVAFPSRFGTPKFTLGGFAGGFTKLEGTVNFTNSATPTAFTEPYAVWRSTIPGNGNMTFTVE